MIKTVRISNFKSVQELEIELGRLNVFIGENGCGKTSILEGIAMGSAASQRKLENEYLVVRGIRTMDMSLMKSAFNTDALYRDIKVGFSFSDGNGFTYAFNREDGLNEDWDINTLTYNGDTITYNKFKELSEVAVDEELKQSVLLFAYYLFKDAEKTFNESGKSAVKDTLFHSSDTTVDNIPHYYRNNAVSSFLLFAPENHFLRRFEEEGQIRPLGIRGEGLFRHLVELSKEEPETLAAISEQLSLIDWFGGLNIPNNLQFTERRIAITDRFIADTIKEFDQRSANEGFLYLLFYFTLFLSKYTPKFFAIDNIDNSLNPKLCAKLVEMLAKLSKENDKQAILTTHNPAILDGLDLTDDEQRLFVIYRNADGETKARRVKPLKKVEGVEEVRLSEAFVRGYLGGLPKNF